jgi:hypothetical protein
MFPAKSLGLALVVFVYATEARQSLSNLYDVCEFTVNHSRYDLCPLFYDRDRDGVVQVRAELSPTIQLYYEVSFSGPLTLITQSGGEVEPQVRVKSAAVPHE